MKRQSRLQAHPLKCCQNGIVVVFVALFLTPGNELSSLVGLAPLQAVGARVDCGVAPVLGLAFSPDENDARSAAESNCGSHNCELVCADFFSRNPECEEYVFPSPNGPYCMPGQYQGFNDPFYFYSSEGECECPSSVSGLD
jgi:hypothetical protein